MFSDSGVGTWGVDLDTDGDRTGAVLAVRQHHNTPLLHYVAPEKAVDRWRESS